MILSTNKQIKEQESVRKYSDNFLGTMTKKFIWIIEKAIDKFTTKMCNNITIHLVKVFQPALQHNVIVNNIVIIMQIITYVTGAR